MALPEEFLQELRARSEISDIASGYISLKRRGRNLVGLCPFHNEKTPSFNLYPETNSFYCFGCGAGGDVVNFIMRIENLDYMEAIKFLAQRAGIQMPEDGYDASNSKLKMRILEANRQAARFYNQCLNSPQGARALEYLTQRQLSASTIKRFGLGYSPDSGFALCRELKAQGFSESEMTAANLAVRSRSGKGVYDRFFDRVMFPIIDVRGNVIAFGGRIMSDKKPKYLNTSDTPVFKKSKNLFSLNNAKNYTERTLILCEGYMDVIALNQAGFINAVATLGTALTNEQAREMRKYADEVIICYDADEAGQKATSRAIDILRAEGLGIRVVTIPDGKDPDEFLKNNGDNGPAAFKNILDNLGNDVDYKLKKLREKYDLSKSDGMVAFLNAAAQLLASLDNPIEREVYAGRLSQETGVEKSAILRQISNALHKNERTRERREFTKNRQELSGFNDKLNPQRPRHLRAARAEEGIIAFLINHPDKAEQLLNSLPPEMMVTDFNRKVYKYFLDKTISGLSPLASVSADFTSDESAKISGIIAANSATATSAAAEEYISIIREQKESPDEQKIAAASDEELLEIIRLKKRRHQ